MYRMAAEPFEVPVEGGTPVRCSLQREEGAEHLGVLLPGRAFGCERPLLACVAGLLAEQGADLLGVHYDLRQVGLEDPALEPRLLAECAAALRAAWQRGGGYRRLTLVGKSLGTWALAGLVQEEPLLAEPERLDVVGLTPCLGVARAAERLAALTGPALWVVGGADRSHLLDVPRRLEPLARNPAAEVLSVPGADHGLRVAGDVRTSVAALGRVLEAVARHLGAAGPAS